jgi:SAM-dependent methyltransferase
MTNSKIELLSCKLLQENKPILLDIELLQKGLLKEIGWHYYVDLIWVVNNLRASGIDPGGVILDAGAGNGLLQYLLAMYGYNIISVDFSPRKISLLVKLIFTINTRGSQVFSNHPYISQVKNISKSKNRFYKLSSLLLKRKLSISSIINLLWRIKFSKINPGKIIYQQADMQSMKEIQDHSIDAVVSISAIEHMDKESIRKAVIEFHRVLKNDHPMILTTSASNNNDWYHQPSKGWCFSKKTIASLFHFDGISLEEFTNYDELISEYKTNTFLKSNLAGIYSISQNNGMPNGEWDPKYLPVGIIRNSQ